MNKSDERSGFFPGIGSNDPALVDRRRLPWWVVCLGTLGMIGLITLGVGIGLNVNVTTGQTCDPAADAVNLVADHERAGNWSAAAATAELGLSRDTSTLRLCHDAQAALARAAVLDGLEAIYDQHPSPADMPTHEALVDDYEHVKTFAARYGLSELSQLSPWQVSRRAYDVEAFLLSQHVLQAAVTAHGGRPTDRSQLRHYDDVLYNLGVWRSRSADEATRSDGFALVRAAYELDVRHDLRSGKPRDYLITHFGADPIAWPTAAADPLLSTAVLGESRGARPVQ